jgi:N-acetylated-alpha-linked acidic dipeptidase
MLKALGGPVVPESWRGALPITYHAGPGPTKVRLKLRFDWSIKTIYNVIARINGAEYPDEWIIYGNHHDAWVNGAEDPTSGMVTVMEAGRAIGEMVRQGWKPRRTIILCAWDGEEPALIGSTEWAETHAEELKHKAVVYLNSDSTGKGWLSAGGSHSLERFVNEVAKDVAQPGSDKSIWEAVRDRRLQQAQTDAERERIKGRADLTINALGSGSDYTPFIQHLGIASLDIRIGGQSGGGIYHSVYDTFNWYTRFSDGTFEYSRALAQMNASVVARLADANVLPFEFGNLAETLKRYVEEIEALAKRGAPPQPIDFAELKSAVGAVAENARRYEVALGKAQSEGFARVKDIKSLNRLLYTSERRLTSNEGLPRRPWFKHQVYAPGFYTGYGVKTMPGVREAIEQNQWNEVAPQMKKIAGALQSLAAQIDMATRMLEGQ